MSGPSKHQPTDGQRVRRAYLLHVYGTPLMVGAFGVALIVAGVLSNQPTALRATEVAVGAVLLIVGALMPRISGPLELSVFRSSFKANLDAMLPEALLLAREVAVEVQPPDDPKKEEKAEEAVQRVFKLYGLRLYDSDRVESDFMNRLIRSQYAELRRTALQGRPADRPEPEQSKGDDEATP